MKKHKNNYLEWVNYVVDSIIKFDKERYDNLAKSLDNYDKYINFIVDNLKNTER